MTMHGPGTSDWRNCFSILLAALMLAIMFSPASPEPAIHHEPMVSAVLPGTANTLVPGTAFTENLGQVGNPDVLFFTSSGHVAFTRDSVLFSLKEPGVAASGMPGEMPEVPRRRSMVAVSFVNANAAMPRGLDQVPWKSNYIFGNDPHMWRTGVPNYGSLIYENLWDGIDLVYRSEEAGLKYDFIVHPGSDPGRIRLKVDGHESLSITDDGALSIMTGLGPGTEIVDSGLDVFYAGDMSEKVPAQFVLSEGGTYSFMLGDWDRSRTLVIDPLIYSTLLGGSGSDFITGVAADAQGNSYVVGYTDSLDFPTVPDAYDDSHYGISYDIFVAKVSPSGDSLLYSTFLGGAGADHASSVAVDSQGHAYVTGYTGSYDFPTTPSAFDRTYNGGFFDGFVTKLSPSGDSLVYSTYLGGVSMDQCNDIAVDANGYAYVTGLTRSTNRDGEENFPLTAGAYGAGTKGLLNVFATKIDQTGSSLVFSSVFGSDDNDQGNGIAVDDSGNVYVTGYTRSAAFPTTSGVFDSTHNGGYDAFVVKLHRSGNSAMYSTFLGGSDGDFGQSIAVGRFGFVHITGYTFSTDFPATAGAFSTANSGWADVFVAGLTPMGDFLVYSTYLGGEGGDYGHDIVVDDNGNIIVTGYTASEDFPTTERAFDRTHNGKVDAFVTKFSPGCTALAYSTFLGGYEADIGRSIAIDSNGYSVVVGHTASSNFPTSQSAFSPTFNGRTDSFIVKIDLADPVADAGPDQWVPEGSIVTFDGSKSTDNHGIVDYTWSFHDGMGNVTLGGESPTHTFLIPGSYEVRLNVTDAVWNADADTVIINVLDITHPIAVAGPDQDVDEGSVVTFNGSASTDNVGIVNYTWSFRYRDEDVALQGTVRHFFFRVPGHYVVNLTVSDAAGNRGSDFMNLTVRDITPPRADTGRNRSVRKGNDFMFNGSASNDNVGIVSYTWTFNDGARDVVLHGMTPSHFFDVVGVYTVLLTVADAAGHISMDTMALSVLEIIDPAANAGPDQTVNEMEPMRFDGSASTDNVAVTRWEWWFNDGINDIVLFGVSPAWSFTVPGIYKVTLNASDAAGNWDTDSMTVTVLDVIGPKPLPGPNRIVAPGEAVTLDGSGSWDSSGIVSYEWSFRHNGTQVVLDGPVQTFTFWSPGTYTVTLTVTDAAGNSASGETTVTVLDSVAHEPGIREYFWALALKSAVIMAVLALLLRRSGTKGGRR